MTPTELAHDLSTLVAAVDGVTGLYDARPLVLAALSGAAEPIAQIVAGASAPGDPVLVEEHSKRITVTIAMSVSDSEPAPATSRRVYDQVETWLAEHPDAPVVDAITVRVGHVGSRRAFWNEPSTSSATTTTHL